MTFRIKLLGAAGPLRFGTPPPPGSWLKSYDPEYARGQGDAVWTADPAQAMTFGSMVEAMACWQQVPKSRPVRADGRPNRPLTGWNVEIEPVP